LFVGLSFVYLLHPRLRSRGSLALGYCTFAPPVGGAYELGACGAEFESPARRGESIVAQGGAAQQRNLGIGGTNKSEPDEQREEADSSAVCRHSLAFFPGGVIEPVSGLTPAAAAAAAVLREAAKMISEW